LFADKQIGKNLAEHSPSIVSSGTNQEILPDYMDRKMTEGVVITDYIKYVKSQEEKELEELEAKLTDYGLAKTFVKQSFLQKMMAPAFIATALAGLLMLAPLPAGAAQQSPQAQQVKLPTTMLIASKKSAYPDMDRILSNNGQNPSVIMPQKSFDPWINQPVAFPSAG
jgi:hypothetical protein